MSFFRLMLEWWHSSRRKAASVRTQPGKFRFQFESLETRELPSVAVPIAPVKPQSVSKVQVAKAKAQPPTVSVYSILDAPRQDFEKRYASYTLAEKKVIVNHVNKAWSRLDRGATSLERIAAINAYLYQYLVRRSFSGNTRGVEVLRSRYAVCGGMVLTMAEMVYAAGYRARYAFTVGGLAAHSMLEVYYPNGTHSLFDPYHGAMYVIPKSLRPVSLFDVPKYFKSKQPPVLLVQKVFPKTLAQATVTPMSDIRRTYGTTVPAKVKDFRFPEIFTKSLAWGVANSGVATVIPIKLKPRQAVGKTAWAKSSKEPNPWTALSLWKTKAQGYLSWAYKIGDTSQGYRIQHSLELQKLIPGRKYTIQYFISHSVSAKTLAVPSISIRRAGSVKTPGKFKLSVRPNRNTSAFIPQVASYTFKATADTATYRIWSSTAEFTFIGVRLIPAS